MPRETHNIENFVKGIVCSVDVEDVPDNAALWTQDLETQTDDGALLGRKIELEVGAAAYAKGAKTSAWINRDGTKRDLVYHDGVNNRINATFDFYGTPGETNISFTDYPSTSSPITFYAGETQNMLSHNKEVRIARRKSDGTVLAPLWAGYIDFQQFGGSVPGFKIANAAVSVGTSMNGGAGDPALGEPTPNFYRAVVNTGGGYIYGVHWDDDTIYKVNISTLAVTRSPVGLSNIRGLCEDGSNLWVYCQQKTDGVLYNIAKSTLAVNFFCNLAPLFWPAPGGYISDIALTTNGSGTMWFGLSVPDGFQAYTQSQQVPGGTYATSGVLYRCPKPTVGGTISPYDTGLLTFGGCWKPSAGSATPVQDMFSMQKNLVVLSSSQVGYLCSFDNPNAFWKASSGPSGLGGFLFVLTDTAPTMSGGLATDTSGLVVLTRSMYANAVNGAVYSSNKLFYCSGGYINYDNLASIPADNGYVIATAGSSAVSDKEIGTTNEVTYLNGTTIYMVRTNQKAGIDSITTGLATLATTYTGGNQSVGVKTMDGEGGFLASMKYFYKTNYTFDGYQDSPLSIAAMSPPKTKSTGNKSITISIDNKTLLSPRVTAVNLWRATGPEGAGQPTTSYRLVESRPLDLANWTVTSNSCTCTITDTDPNTGITFEKQTGMSDFMTGAAVNYALMAEMNECLFVARCTMPNNEIPDATHYMFRSKPQRCDVFDWATDFMVLPSVPTAIAAYAGRIWVFDTANCYRVNPDDLCIEETFIGYGVPDQRAVCISEFGMVIAAKVKNIWLYDGKEFMPIGNAIRKASSTIPAPWEYVGGYYSSTWNVGHTNFDPVVSYSPALRSIFITVSRTATIVGAYVYSPDRGRWDYWLFPNVASTPAATGTFFGKDGELYYSIAAHLYNIAGGATRATAWRWYSRENGLGDNTQSKKVYKVLLSQTLLSTGAAASINPTVDLANNDTFVALTNSSLPAANRKRKIVQFQIPGGADDKVSSCSIVFRRLEGKR